MLALPTASFYVFDAAAAEDADNSTPLDAGHESDEGTEPWEINALYMTMGNTKTNTKRTQTSQLGER
jgi:hypothetical protein